MKIFSCICLALLLGLGNSVAFAGNEQCAELISNRCQGCHYKSRVCQALGKKSKWKWKRSVSNMVRYGAKLSGAEQKIVIECLSSAPVGADYVCKE